MRAPWVPLAGICIALLAGWASSVAAHSGAIDDFHSPMLGQGESYTATFTVEGAHAYHCHPHPNMKAKLTVAEAAPEGNITIEIRAFQFVPSDAQVRPNSTVTWRNVDSTPHTVERDDPSERHDHGAPGAGALLVLGALLLGLGLWRRKRA